MSSLDLRLLVCWNQLCKAHSFWYNVLNCCCHHSRMATQIGFLDFSLPPPPPPPSFFFFKSSQCFHPLPKLAFFIKYNASYLGCNTYFKINLKIKTSKWKLKTRVLPIAWFFTCSEIRNQIHSVHQITSLVTNVCSKIKDRKYSKSRKAAQIKITFSYTCF